MLTLQKFLSYPFFLAVGGGVEPPTVQLAIKQNFGGQPQSTWKKPVRLYFTFILSSPPPRQEGTAANFVILQYKERTSKQCLICLFRHHKVSTTFVGIANFLEIFN